MTPEESKSIVLDENAKTVKITLNPRLYPQTVVMRASYRFIDDFDVIVDGDPLSKIFVTIKVRSEDEKTSTKGDLEQIANTFFSELIHANVEETQSRRYADTRNALIGAALRNLIPQITPETISNISKKMLNTPNTSKNVKLQKSSDEHDDETPFERVYLHMPKLNCGACGANCEQTAKK